MDIQLVVKNIVVIGDFIPQKFDKYFFLKNNIFEENEILETSIFLPEFCVLQTSFVTVQITSQQLIINDINTDKFYDMTSLTKKIIEYSDLSVSAAGVNFHFYKFSKGDTQNLSKKYFYNENNLINKFFDGDDVNYGYYISKNFDDARLKLDIKPATVQNLESNVSEKLIQFQFNFHVDFQTNSKDKLFSVIENYERYYEEAKKIITIYE